MSSAKRRQTWGEYKYYNPSRFIEEIPHDLLESTYSESDTRATFKSAVQARKAVSDSWGRVQPTNSFGSDFKAPQIRNLSDTQVSNGTGFGKNFVAPQKRNTTGNNVASSSNRYGSNKQDFVKRTPSRTILVKSKANKIKDEEKVKAFFEDNAIKRMLEERNKQDQQAMIAQAEKEKSIAEAKEVNYFFNVGERVFHDKLGVGHIIDVSQIGESTMYTIDFGKMGKKAMDANYAHLKKF